MRSIPLVLASVLALAGCAQSDALKTTRADTSDATRCFRTDDIRNFRAANTTDLYVRTSRDNVFLITTTGCWDMDTALAIAVTPGRGGGGYSCVGDPVDVRVPGGAGAGNGRCRGLVTKSLTAEEAAALPSRSRP